MLIVRAFWSCSTCYVQMQLGIILYKQTDTPTHSMKSSPCVRHFLVKQGVWLPWQTGHLVCTCVYSVIGEFCVFGAGPPRERGLDVFRAERQPGHQILLRLREHCGKDSHEAVRQQYQKGVCVKPKITPDKQKSKGSCIGFIELVSVKTVKCRCEKSSTWVSQPITRCNCINKLL